MKGSQGKSASRRLPGNRRTKSQPGELRCYYHVTRPEHVESIRETGLRADSEGRIFVLTEPWVADAIARDQVFAVPEFALFAVSGSGVTGPVEPDQVAEFTRGYHRVLRQPRVAPEYLTYLGTQTRNWSLPLEWDYFYNERAMGLSREVTAARFEVMWLSCQGKISADAANERLTDLFTAATRHRAS